MVLINLECVLMPNNEILFNSRSLGYLTDEEIKRFTKAKQPVKEIVEELLKTK